MNQNNAKVWRATKRSNQTPCQKLLSSFLLLCLKDWSLHGYKLIQMLIDIGFSSVDQGNVYRTLRKLEKPYFFYLGYKRWRAGKRIYSLTEYGEQYLTTCATSFEHYQNMLRTFSRYTPMHSFHFLLLQKG